MANKIKKLPKFENEDQEREFWAKHDTTEYFDPKNKIDLNLSNLKPSSKIVTIRMPESMIYDLKRLANKKDVPYQSLAKVFLAERIRDEAL